ncbi:efflux transporter, outer membrane factor lipoprotein, NodT family, partial [Necator americanus]
HAIHDADQSIDVVPFRVHRQTLAEIATDDFFDGCGHRVEPPHRRDANQARADQSDHECEHGSGKQRVQQLFVEVVELSSVLALQGDTAVGQARGDASSRRVARQIREAHRKRLVEIGDRWLLAGVSAGQVFPASVEKRERALSARVELVLMLESCDQFIRGLAYQFCVFPHQPVVDAFLFEAGNLAIEVAEEQNRDHTEQRQKQRGEAKASGVVQFSQAHAGCTPNRARYRSSATSRPAQPAQQFHAGVGHCDCRQARGNAEKAGAPQYPLLTLGGTFDRSHQGRGSTTKTQSLFAEASYEVDFWGFNAANANASELLVRASEFDRDTVALTLSASVADTYFQVQSLRRRLVIARTISDDASRILQLLLAQQVAGVATGLQVQQQRNALATFQAAVPALQQQLDTSMHALAVLVGTAPEQFTVREVPFADIVIPQPRANLPASLLETRPDIRSREAQLQSANQSVGAARAAFLPNIVLTADGGLSSKSLSHFLSSPFASIAASLAAPIFDGGALRGQLRASRAAETKDVADYRQAVVSALQDSRIRSRRDSNC